MVSVQWICELFFYQLNVSLPYAALLYKFLLSVSIIYKPNTLYDLMQSWSVYFWSFCCISNRKAEMAETTFKTLLLCSFFVNKKRNCTIFDLISVPGA